MKHLKFFYLIPLASVTVFTLFSVPASANGVSRGGGNAIVCFKNKKFADLFKVFDPSTQVVTSFKPLTNIVLAEHGDEKNPIESPIESIEMLDLHIARQDTGLSSNSELQILTVGDTSDVKNESPEKLDMNLDSQYSSVISRVRDILPSIYSKLVEAGDKLKLNQIKKIETAPFPILDVNLLEELDPRCVLSTVVVQTGVLNAQPVWLYDPRIFFHSKFGRLNQFVAILHERVYLIGRTYEQMNSYQTSILVSQLLKKETTAEEVLSSFRALTSSDEFRYELTPAGQVTSKIRTMAAAKLKYAREYQVYEWLTDFFKGVENEIHNYTSTFIDLETKLAQVTTAKEYIDILWQQQFLARTPNIQQTQHLVQSRCIEFKQALDLHQKEMDDSVACAKENFLLENTPDLLIQSLPGMNQTQKEKVRNDLHKNFLQDRMDRFSVTLEFPLP